MLTIRADEQEIGRSKCCIMPVWPCFLETRINKTIEARRNGPAICSRMQEGERQQGWQRAKNNNNEDKL